MSLGRSISVLWRGQTGGKEGFRENSRLVVLDAEEKALRLGFDTESALKVGLGEALLNLNKLLPFVDKRPEHALEESTIFLGLAREGAIERLLDYLVWKRYQDPEARNKLQSALGPLIQTMIDQEKFDPIKEMSNPTFPWSAFTPDFAVSKAWSVCERSENRKPWETTEAERRLGAQELRRRCLEYYDRAKSSVYCENKSPDRVHLYCLYWMVSKGWEYMVAEYGRAHLQENRANLELEPFLRLDPEQARALALEYVVWRMYPDQANQAMIKEAVLAHVDQMKQECPGMVEKIQPGTGAVFWMDLINGDRLARPWGDQTEWA